MRFWWLVIVATISSSDNLAQLAREPFLAVVGSATDDALLIFVVGWLMAVQIRDRDPPRRWVGATQGAGS